MCQGGHRYSRYRLNRRLRRGAHHDAIGRIHPSCLMRPLAATKRRVFSVQCSEYRDKRLFLILNTEHWAWFKPGQQNLGLSGGALIISCSYSAKRYSYSYSTPQRGSPATPRRRSRFGLSAWSTWKRFSHGEYFRVRVRVRVPSCGLSTSTI